MALLRQVQIARQMVTPNALHAAVDSLWWGSFASQTSAIVTMVMEQREAIALKPGLINVLLVPMAIQWPTIRARKISAPVPMGRPLQDRVAHQPASPNVPHAALVTILLMILASRTNAHALMVLARLAPIAQPTERPNVLPAAEATHFQVRQATFARRYSAVVLMAQLQQEQNALRLASTNVLCAQVATPR